MRRTAIITGGTRGIGRGIALRLASCGYDLVLAYRACGEAAAAAADECRRLGAGVETVRADVSSGADVERLFRAAARFPSLDLLVNNASRNIDKPCCDLSEADWDTVVDTNLKGVFLCSRAAAAMMAAQPSGGAIVNIGASTGIQGRRNGANYCAAKAGVIVLTKCLALELAPAIRVNCVIPGSIAGTGRERSAAEVRERQAGIPLGRLGSPADVAEAVAFVASERAAYITGQKLLVDGGQFMF